MFTNNRYADYLPVHELELVRRAPGQKTPIKPLQAGDIFPSFQIHKKHIITAADALKPVNGPVPVTQLLDRPLVLAFHSLYWNSYGNTLLQRLQDIYADIRVMGGQLLLATAEPRTALQAAGHHLPFATIWDQHNSIAAKAGIYSSTDPVWDRLSGINADVPVPGIFVLTPSLKITYSATDEWFDKPFSNRDLLTAVYGASQENSRAGIAV